VLWSLDRRTQLMSRFRGLVNKRVLMLQQIKEKRERERERPIPLPSLADLTRLSDTRPMLSLTKKKETVLVSFHSSNNPAKQSRLSPLPPTSCQRDFSIFLISDPTLVLARKRDSNNDHHLMASLVRVMSTRLKIPAAGRCSLSSLPPRATPSDSH
jgi:hypothetical protein